MIDGRIIEPSCYSYLKVKKDNHFKFGPNPERLTTLVREVWNSNYGQVKSYTAFKWLATASKSTQI